LVTNRVVIAKTRLRVDCQHEERTAQFCYAVVALAQKHCTADGNDKQKLYRSCGMMARGAEVGDVYNDAHDTTGG